MKGAGRLLPSTATAAVHSQGVSSAQSAPYPVLRTQRNAPSHRPAALLHAHCPACFFSLCTPSALALVESSSAPCTERKEGPRGSLLSPPPCRPASRAGPGLTRLGAPPARPSWGRGYSPCCLQAPDIAANQLVPSAFQQHESYPPRVSGAPPAARPPRPPRPAAPPAPARGPGPRRCCRQRRPCPGLLPPALLPAETPPRWPQSPGRAGQERGCTQSSPRPCGRLGAGCCCTTPPQPGPWPWSPCVAINVGSQAITRTLEEDSCAWPPLVAPLMAAGWVGDGESKW